jgi:ubiquinone/menaquinone biosynthesis C-methylase UbiE
MTTPAITKYDQGDYDYSKYWERGRAYEHAAEEIALKRLLAKIPVGRREVFADLGGGYGRLMPIYAPLFKYNILLDYSIKNLQQGVALAKKNGITNISFVAANLYNLPFREEAIDTAAIVRVIHHIKDINLLFTELSRAIAHELILDIPNKRHFPAVIRGLFRGKLKEILSKIVLASRAFSTITTPNKFKTSLNHMDSPRVFG